MFGGSTESLSGQNELKMFFNKPLPHQFGGAFLWYKKRRTKWFAFQICLEINYLTYIFLFTEPESKRASRI
jgi:hypothetical protein